MAEGLHRREGVEIGLHLHMQYDLVRALGVEERASPFVRDPSPGCDTSRTVDDGPQGRNGGYDVLLTGYSPRERRQLLEGSVSAFLKLGLPRPTAFRAGYSAADPPLNALLVEAGFAVSFSAQAVGPADYPRCWYRQLEWRDRITPLTLPCRVSRDPILPPPHPGEDHLDLVEVPLTLGCGANDLYLGDGVVSREGMFDRHLRWAADAGQDTAVAIGVHADVVGRETWPDGRIARALDRFLGHVERRAQERAIEIRFGTGSEVARRSIGNVSLRSVPYSEPPPSDIHPKRSVLT